jgi:hypothetical protein
LFPGFLSGPAILYPQYAKFARNRAPNLHHQKRHQWAIVQFLKAASFGVAHVALKNAFNHATVLSPQFQQMSLINRLMFIHMATMAIRFMYYTAWLMAEASLVNMGFEIGQVQIVRPLQIELATDPREILLNWNISTDRWLHRYFYVRLRKSLGTSISNILVKLISAVWHGFYPGYYFTFISYGLLAFTSRSMYRNVSWPLPKWSKGMFVYVPLWMVLDFITVPFVLLSWSASVQFYNSMHWWAHILCILILAFISLRGR